MIQDIAPCKYQNAYTPCVPEDQDFVFLFRENEILCRNGEELWSVPTVAEYGKDGLQYLFSVDGKRFFLGTGTVEGYAFQPLRVLRNCVPGYLGFAGMTAYHLYHWYSTHRLCGKCGTPVQHHETLRALSCPHCGNLIFPVIAPAVIVGVVDGDRILITRYAGREHKGIALIAGFCEIGERAEDTVHREVMEEAGVRVRNLRYFDSQPWGFASDLLLGFFAQLDGSEEIHMDTEELQFAQWIRREDLPEQDNLASLTATMIDYFKKHGAAGIFHRDALQAGGTGHV